MNAQKLSEKLKLVGIPVIGVSEADDVCDGAIYITADLHVQVPDEGRHLCTVSEENDGFLFGELTTSFEKLVNEIRVMLAPK